LHKNDALTNYFIASTNSNPNLDRIVSSISENIAHGVSKEISELTGPAMLGRSLSGQRLTTAYYKYTCYQGTFPNEFFQYVDHPQGKWTRAQKVIDVIKQ
jgi:mannosyltransferase OCH1-like enzyme